MTGFACRMMTEAANLGKHTSIDLAIYVPHSSPPVSLPAFVFALVLVAVNKAVRSVALHHLKQAADTHISNRNARYGRQAGWQQGSSCDRLAGVGLDCIPHVCPELALIDCTTRKAHHALPFLLIIPPLAFVHLCERGQRFHTAGYATMTALATFAASPRSSGSSRGSSRSSSRGSSHGRPMQHAAASVNAPPSAYRNFPQPSFLSAL